jgi:metallo-beta-lactamase family protein
VTGSRYLIETPDVRVLIDCGMFQQREELFRNWEPSPGPPETVDHMLLTHGESEAADSLAGHIRQELGWDATVPAYGDVCELNDY